MLENIVGSILEIGLLSAILFIVVGILMKSKRILIVIGILLLVLFSQY